MLRFAVACLALVAVVSAFDTNMLRFSISQSIANLQFSFNVLDAPPTNTTYYFSCDALAITYKKKLDVFRDLGMWYVTNTAFSLNHRISPSDVQDSINRNIGCVKNNLTYIDDHLLNTADVVYRQNITFPIPPGSNVINGTTLEMVTNSFPARESDFGWWVSEQYNPASGNKFMQDVFVVDTDYTNFTLAYTCSDIPVPMSMDTAREQQWVILRRQPLKWSADEISAIKLVAGLHGIVDFDNLYELPMDQC